MASFSSSVAQFFNQAAQSPFSQLTINWRERSTQLGEALVQSGIELQIRRRLQSGLIRLISTASDQEAVEADLPQVQEAALPQVEEAALPPVQEAKPVVVTRVRTLELSPLPVNTTCADVRAALLRANIRVTAVRPLTSTACEVSVDASPEVDQLFDEGLYLHEDWSLRARDLMRKRHQRGSGRLTCFLCDGKDHIEFMCIRQRPKIRCMLGA